MQKKKRPGRLGRNATDRSRLVGSPPPLRPVVSVFHSNHFADAERAWWPDRSRDERGGAKTAPRSQGGATVVVAWNDDATGQPLFHQPFNPLSQILFLLYPDQLVDRFAIFEKNQRGNGHNPVF